VTDLASVIEPASGIEPVEIKVVDWLDPRAITLRDAMNVETGAMYAKFTASQSPETTAAIDASLAVDPESIAVTIIAFAGDTPVGHSALRPFGDELEVKKVFTDPAARGLGVAKRMLAWLEEYAVAHGVTSLVLQTGSLQVEAIGLYEAIGYRHIPVFGAYSVIPGAICMRKQL